MLYGPSPLRNAQLPGDDALQAAEPTPENTAQNAIQSEQSATHPQIRSIRSRSSDDTPISPFTRSRPPKRSRSDGPDANDEDKEAKFKRWRGGFVNCGCDDSGEDADDEEDDDEYDDAGRSPDDNDKSECEGDGRNEREDDKDEDAI